MSQISYSTKQNKHILRDNPKGKQKVIAAHKITKVIFTTRILIFNATFRTRKKLLGIMRFSETLKIASFRPFCKKSPLSSETTRRL